jgi:hypothetical protein
MPRPNIKEPPYVPDPKLYQWMIDVHNAVFGVGADVTGNLDKDNLSAIFPSLAEDETVTGEWTFSTHPLGLDHPKIANIGAYTHPQIDGHIDDDSLHVPAHLLASDPHTQYQKESEKGVASGYASLESDVKVTVAQLRNPVWIGVSAPDPNDYPLWLDISGA